MRMDVWFMLITFFVLFSCGNAKEHTAPAINEKDSVSLMISYGVNTLISDSGVIKYRIVTEQWDVNTMRQPSRWTFIKGLFMEQFDENFNIQAYIQADTAWYYDQLKLWELRGRVKVRNVNGMVFTGNELFWDGTKREIYSYKFSRVISPERTMEGTYFRSDESMTYYTISNSAGSFVRSDIIGDEDDEHDMNGNSGENGDVATVESDNANDIKTVQDTASAIRKRRFSTPSQSPKQLPSSSTSPSPSPSAVSPSVSPKTKEDVKQITPLPLMKMEKNQH